MPHSLPGATGKFTPAKGQLYRCCLCGKENGIFHHDWYGYDTTRCCVCHTCAREAVEEKLRATRRPAAAATEPLRPDEM